MTDGQFTHKFPEWQLDLALAEAIAGKPELLWQRAVVRSANAADPTSLASWFPGPQALAVTHQRALAKGEAGRYGIEAAHYLQTYWSLRPDFTLESANLSTLVVLEAKGGQPGPSVWVDPKELRYYQLLRESPVPRSKAFLYVVPAFAGAQCMDCVRTYFDADMSIRTGVIYWEDLLDLIYESLMGVAVDYMVSNMEGVQRLRAWRRRPSNPALQPTGSAGG